ncbi:MAG: extracellular solute-binding protein [Candidatus Paceibacterota bacterium]|jgi:multiple sugar transport system substrate-binding protein
MKHRIHIFIIAAALLAGGLGCKGLSAEQQQAIVPVALNYWTVFDNVDELRKNAEEYKKLRPYVTINIRQIRYEEFDKIFVNALADDVGPDIVSIHTRWLRKYQNRLAEMPASVKVASITTEGQIQPKTVVTIETNRMPTVDILKNNYLSTVVDDAVIDGKIYGLPLSVDTLALFYNKDLMDAAGVALPPATWPDFLEAVQKTTKFDKKGAILQAGAAMGTGSNIDNAFDILSLLMMQNGVTMAQGSRVSFTDGLDGSGRTAHPAMEALRFYTDFARPTKEVYTWNDAFGPAIDEFARGKAVFYIGFAFDLARIRARAPQMNIGVAPVPQLNEVNPVNVANYWLESVSRKSKYQNEAWDFVRFLSTPTVIKSYNDASALPSPLRAHLAEQEESATLAPFVTGLLRAKNWYHGKDIDAANAAMKEMATRYLRPPSDAEAHDPARRDAEILIHAAAVIQQTL